MLEIDASKIHYRVMNEQLREAVKKGEKHIVLRNVEGHRYIGDGVRAEGVRIDVYGTAGNDLATFMNGPTVHVYGNAQDGVGNTMNVGKIYVHGDAGDVLFYGMRGGTVFVNGDVGYRVGIHMKEYMDLVPKVVIGGCAGDFFGEYMAGGVMILLGLDASKDKPIVGDYLTTGMHGGKIYIRGEVDPMKLGKEAKIFDLDDSDWDVVNPLLDEFCTELGHKKEEILKVKFHKLIPVSKRPYGSHYVPFWHLLTNREVILPKTYEDVKMGYPKVRNTRYR